MSLMSMLCPCESLFITQCGLADPPTPILDSNPGANNGEAEAARVRQRSKDIIPKDQVSRTRVSNVGRSCFKCKILNLASSTAGCVYVARTLALQDVAIKEIDLSHQSQNEHELILNEILLVKECHHPNIIEFFEFYIVESKSLWVVMEYMDGGALSNIVRNKALGEGEISSICFEVCLSFVLCLYSV
jgi:hypothetical protein